MTLDESFMKYEDNINENKATYLQKYRDEADVNVVVDMFWAIRNRLNVPQNDIDWWIKKPFQALKDFVQSYDPSNKRQRRDVEYRRQMIDNDARMLGSRDGYEIWYVPTYEAMRTIGRFYKGVSTQWCVASDDPSFWFDMHDQSEFIVLVRENMQYDEFDKLAIEMQNGGRAFDVDEFLVWDVENEDDRACIDDLMHYAWELFVQNGERRHGL